MEIANETPWDTEIGMTQLSLDEALDVIKRATEIARYHQERLDRLNIERIRWLGRHTHETTLLSD